MQVMFAAETRPQRNHSVSVHPGPKFSIFSELCLIDTSSVYSKQHKKIAKKKKRIFRQISERQDLLHNFCSQSHKAVA